MASIWDRAGAWIARAHELLSQTDEGALEQFLAPPPVVHAGPPDREAVGPIGHAGPPDSAFIGLPHAGPPDRTVKPPDTRTDLRKEFDQVFDIWAEHWQITGNVDELKERLWSLGTIYAADPQMARPTDEKLYEEFGRSITIPGYMTGAPQQELEPYTDLGDYFFFEPTYQRDAEGKYLTTATGTSGWWARQKGIWPDQELDATRNALDTLQVAIANHYGVTRENVLIVGTQAKRAMDAAQSLMTYAQSRDSEGLINGMTALSKEFGWLNDVLLDSAMPQLLEIEDFTKDVKQRYTIALTNLTVDESLTKIREDNRVRDIKVILGRELNSRELRAVMAAATSADLDTATFPYLAKAYKFHENMGVLTDRKEAGVQWVRFMNDPTIPQSVKETLESTGPDAFYSLYELSSQQAYTRAIQSAELIDVSMAESAFGAAPFAPENVVPYSPTTFEDVLNLQASLYALQFAKDYVDFDAIYEAVAELAPEEQEAAVKAYLDEQLGKFGWRGISQVPQGWSAGEFMEELKGVVGSDEELFGRLVTSGLVPIPPSAVLQAYTPEAIGTARRLYGAQFRTPEERMAFEGQFRQTLPTLFSMYQQQRVPGDTVRTQGREFLNWLGTQDFTTEKYSGAFSSLQTTKKPVEGMTLKQPTPKFGIGR